MVSMFKIARESLLEALGLASHDVNGAWLQMLSTESLKSIMRDFNTNYELPAEQGGIVPHAEKYRIDKSQIQSDLFNDPARFRNATATEQKSWTRHEWYRWAILRIVDESGLPLFQKEEHDMRDKISTGVTVFEAMRMHWTRKGQIKRGGKPTLSHGEAIERALNAVSEDLENDTDLQASNQAQCSVDQARTESQPSQHTRDIPYERGGTVEPAADTSTTPSQSQSSRAIRIEEACEECDRTKSGCAHDKFGDTGRAKLVQAQTPVPDATKKLPRRTDYDPGLSVSEQNTSNLLGPGTTNKSSKVTKRKHGRSLDDAYSEVHAVEKDERASLGIEGSERRIRVRTGTNDDQRALRACDLPVEQDAIVYGNNEDEQNCLELELIVPTAATLEPSSWTIPPTPVYSHSNSTKLKAGPAIIALPLRILRRVAGQLNQHSLRDVPHKLVYYHVSDTRSLRSYLQRGHLVLELLDYNLSEVFPNDLAKTVGFHSAEEIMPVMVEDIRNLLRDLEEFNATSAKAWLEAVDQAHASGTISATEHKGFHKDFNPKPDLITWNIKKQQETTKSPKKCQLPPPTSPTTASQPSQAADIIAQNDIIPDTSEVLGNPLQPSTTSLEIGGPNSAQQEAPTDAQLDEAIPPSVEAPLSDRLEDLRNHLRRTISTYTSELKLTRDGLKMMVELSRKKRSEREDLMREEAELAENIESEQVHAQDLEVSLGRAETALFALA